MVKAVATRAQPIGNQKATDASGTVEVEVEVGEEVIAGKILSKWCQSWREKKKSASEGTGDVFEVAAVDCNCPFCRRTIWLMAGKHVCVVSRQVRLESGEGNCEIGNCTTGKCGRGNFIFHFSQFMTVKAIVRENRRLA